MALFVATEATLFGALVGTLRLPPLPQRRTGRRPASPSRALLAPVLLTALLVSSSVPMQLAWRAGRAARRARRGCWLALAIAVQSAT